MAMKKVVDLGSGNKTISLGGLNSKTNKPNPTEIKGYFLGSRSVEANGKATNIYTFQTPEGNVDVWSKSDLDRKLAQVAPGTYTEVVYTGTKKTPKGRMFVFDVAFNDEDTINMDDYSTANSSSEGSSDEDADLDDYVEGGYSNGVDEDALQEAALADAAAKQAKVKNLLKGNKTAKN